MLEISYPVAFFSGLASFLLPCTLPLVPVYLGSLAGPDIFVGGAYKKKRVPVFLHSLSFVAGFTIVFVIMGVGAGLAGFVISSHLAVIRQIAGAMLIFFGLFMLASLKIPWLNYEKRLSPSRGITTGYLRSFSIGAIYPLAVTSCGSYILGGILTLAASSKTAWHGAYLLAVYSLGLGIPFLVIGAAFDSVAPFLKRIQRYSTVIYIFGGILLITVGILILTNKLYLLLTII